MAGVSTGSSNEVLATNAGLWGLKFSIWDNIQFQREPKYPHRAGQGIAVAFTSTQNHFPAAL